MMKTALAFILLQGAMSVALPLAPLATLTAAEQALPSRPNVLIIQTDEHNFRTLGCYRALLPKEQAFVWGDGLAVETPHIDSLAKRGALCDRFYAASPVCTPSRASFVTGRYPQNTGASMNDRPMRDDVVTFAEALRRKGYATGYTGKWHVDSPARPGWSPGRKFGFEDNRYLFNRGHWKQLEDTPNGPAVKARNAKGGPTYNVIGADEKSFTTDFLADKTVTFIRAHKSEPFCFMLSLPDPCLFDLGQDPFEMRNLFSAPASRPIVRELAQALLGYAQRSKEPYAAEPAMHADLAWAAAGTGAYAPPHRDAAKARKARVVNDDGE